MCWLSKLWPPPRPLDFLAPLKTSKRGQAAHAAIRGVCPTMEKDRVMYTDFARTAEMIATGKIAAALM